MKQEDMPSMTPPKPIDDDLFTWMVGEWEGKTEGTMGKTKDWQKIEWSLDKQWVTVNYTGKFESMSPEQMKMMKENMKMTDDDIKKMMDMPYKGIGQFTLDPETGEFMGYWFDNWRGVYKGTGKREGNKSTVSWEGPRGTSLRTMERVSDDKMVETFKDTDTASGMVMEGKSEWTRKKSKEK
ncbi:MAG: hypothetical protein HY707_13950 [Ignavibacteriae bacterium]|nr:hypothetical protein [Ignavibacteriota bacterium]